MYAIRSYYGQSSLKEYPTANGGPVVISSNNGASIIASLLQFRRPGTSGGWTVITHRITSYNVCYTKLLRSFLFLSAIQHFVQVVVLQSLLHLVTLLR